MITQTAKSQHRKQADMISRILDQNYRKNKEKCETSFDQSFGCCLQMKLARKKNRPGQFFHFHNELNHGENESELLSLKIG